MLSLGSALRSRFGMIIGLFSKTLIFDFSFLNALVKRLDEAIKESPKREIYSKALKAVLEKSNINDPTVKNTIKSILQGIN